MSLIQKRFFSSMVIRPVLFIAFFLGISCTSGMQSNAVEASQTDYIFHGAFISLPNGRQYQSVSSTSDGLALGLGDTAVELNDCSTQEFPLCYYSDDTGHYFAVPNRSLNTGDQWTFRDREFTAVASIGEIKFIDVRSTALQEDMLRFIYTNGSVKAFMWGDLIENEECYECFDPRVTYVWTGENSFNSAISVRK